MENIELLKKYVSMTDDQWVMRQRLLRFYDKVYNHRIKELDQIGKYVRHFATLGLRSLIAAQVEPEKADEIISHEVDKVKLEFIFENGVMPTQSEMEYMLERYQELHQMRSRYYDKMDKFQSHYQVSGLTMVDYEFTDFDGKIETVTLPGWDELVPLKLIESDLDILSQWKDYLYLCWINRLKDFKLCQWNEKKDCYELTTLDNLEACLSDAKWANPMVYCNFPTIFLGGGLRPNSYGTESEFVAIPKDMSINRIPV